MSRFVRSPAMSLGAGKVLAIATASLLAACAVRVYEPAPPPPPMYVPPPPPPVAAVVAGPGVEVALTAPEPPPPLPDYEQPPIPEEGYIWTPGYWHWSPAGYYWVPGTWVQPPMVGLLWTPGYWGLVGGVYGWHVGYWGPHVGYYGGVNYGYGYVGVGFVGGRWEGNRFAYNTAVNNVNTTVIHNTYNQTVVNNITINKVSYNGGPGGVTAAPSPQERAAAQEAHVPQTAAQTSHMQEAYRNPALFAKANGGHPAILATARPGAFTGPGVVAAHGAPITNTAMMHGVNAGNGAIGGVPAKTPGALPPGVNGTAQPQSLAPKPPVTYQPQTQYAKPPVAKGNPPSNGKPPHPDKEWEGERH